MQSLVERDYFTDYEILKEPYAFFDALREHGPIYRPPGKDYYVVTGFDEAAPRYLNAVVVADISIDPEQLLDAVHRIEHEHGRVRTAHWGDRTLDIDILSVGDLIRQTTRLTLPHPRAAERAFVLVPWSEVDPDAVIPGRGKVSELLDDAAGAVLPYPAAPLLEVVQR